MSTQLHKAIMAKYFISFPKMNKKESKIGNIENCALHISKHDYFEYFKQ